jgi:peroxiredoxin
MLKKKYKIKTNTVIIMKKIVLSMVFMAIATLAMAQNATLPQNITIKALDGTSVQTSALQNDGKPMIISFWATWCKPCNRELNTIKEVYEEWQEETGVKLVAISIDDARSANRVKPHVDGNGWDYEVYLDQNQDFKRAMNVVNVPHTFVINGKGEIVWQHTSFVEGSEEELLEVVKKAAAETAE